jgi:integrase
LAPNVSPSLGRKRILSLLAVRPGYGSGAVLVFAYCGLRWSELAALRVCDVDLAAHRLSVVERTTEIGGRLNTAAPKSKKARQVAIPRAPWRECWKLGLRVDRPMISSSRLRTVDPCATSTGAVTCDGTRSVPISALTDSLPMTFVGLSASLARLAGADLKYIQKAMGHSSITVTAEIYAQLFDSELDQVSDALDALTDGVAESVYAQNTPIGPDPGSDRAP